MSHVTYIYHEYLDRREYHRFFFALNLILMYNSIILLNDIIMFCVDFKDFRRKFHFKIFFYENSFISQHVCCVVVRLRRRVFGLAKNKANRRS